MLTPEGLKEILDRPDWWTRPPALLLWALLGASLLLIGFGCCSDARVRRSGLWREEYFLTDLPPAQLPRAKHTLCFSCFRSTSAPAVEPGPQRSEKSKSWLAMRGFSALSESPAAAAALARQNLLHRMKPSLASGIEERTICRNTLRLGWQHKKHEAGSA